MGALGAQADRGSEREWQPAPHSQGARKSSSGCTESSASCEQTTSSFQKAAAYFAYEATKQERFALMEAPVRALRDRTPSHASPRSPGLATTDGDGLKAAATRIGHANDAPSRSR
jgi:hypothetical protein